MPGGRPNGMLGHDPNRTPAREVVQATTGGSSYRHGRLGCRVLNAGCCLGSLRFPCGPSRGVASVGGWVLHRAKTGLPPARGGWAMERKPRVYVGRGPWMSARSTMSVGRFLPDARLREVHGHGPNCAAAHGDAQATTAGFDRSGSRRVGCGSLNARAPSAPVFQRRLLNAGCCLRFLWLPCGPWRGVASVGGWGLHGAKTGLRRARMG